MIDVNQLRKGATFLRDDEIFEVLNYQHIKPGRGNATIRVGVRNMRSGATTDMTFNSGTRVQDIELDERKVEYLYDDGSFLSFMDLETYEQPQMRREVFGTNLDYLKPGLQLKLKTYEDEIMSYELPNVADYKVTEADMAIAGDTAGAATKKVTIETGLIVKVPMFVQAGDTIRVNTQDGSYVTRV